MVAVQVVQAAVDQVIKMIAMRHFLVTATLMSAWARDRGAVIGVGRIYRQDVLLVMTFVGIVQAAIVQIIDVAVMPDAGVSTVFTVDMLMVLVNFVSHRPFLF
jgi:hypothetical protein